MLWDRYLIHYLGIVFEFLYFQPKNDTAKQLQQSACVVFVNTIRNKVFDNNTQQYNQAKQEIVNRMEALWYILNENENQINDSENNQNNNDMLPPPNKKPKFSLDLFNVSSMNSQVFYF